jgi:hypothetical protein
MMQQAARFVRSEETSGRVNFQLASFDVFCSCV